MTDYDESRMKAEACDILSFLPDDLIHIILSFVGLKEAVKTSVLSSRWRYKWTSIPCLDFSSVDFATVRNLSDFVTGVLSRLDDQMDLSVVDLYLRQKDSEVVLERIMDYAASCNVQQLNVSCLFESKQHLVFTSVCDFSCLTTLQLSYVTLYDGFFSLCPNLKNLTLRGCNMMDSYALRIYLPHLSNLTVENADMNTYIISLVTPQLENLTISESMERFQIFAPKLASLTLKGYCTFMFLPDCFDSLEKAVVSLHSPHAPSVVSLFKKLCNVKVLSLSMEVIECLNSSAELISHQPSPFANLTSLKILPKTSCLMGHVELVMSAELKNYLLKSSSKSTLTEVWGWGFLVAFCHIAHEHIHRFLPPRRSGCGVGVAGFTTERHFGLNWAFVDPNTPIESGMKFCVCVKEFFPWLRMPLQVVYANETKSAKPLAASFSFGGGTLAGHLLSGEERFSIEMDEKKQVWYEIVSFSKPAHALSVIGYPYVFLRQKYFAHQSSDVDM